MANGLSGVGFQEVLVVPAVGSNYFRVVVSAPRGDFPRRLGYLFVRKVYTYNGFFDYVIFRDPVYSPGIYFKVPDTGSVADHTYVVSVNWNLSGVSWDVHAE